MLPQEQAGLFFLAHTVLTVLSVLFRFGLEDLVLREFSKKPDGARPQGFFIASLVSVFIVTSIVSILLMWTAGAWVELAFGKPGLLIVVPYILWSLPFMASLFLFSGMFQGSSRYVLATICQNFGSQFLFVVIVGAAWLANPELVSVKFVSIAFTTSVCILVLLVSVIWWRDADQVPFQQIPAYICNDELLSFARRFSVIKGVQVLVAWSGVLFCGMFVSAQEVAVFSLALRIATLMAVILMISNMLMIPVYARLWHTRSLTELKVVAQRATRLSILVAFPLFLGVFIYAEPVMSLFGPGFVGGADLLRILVFGQFINVATGAVMYLLTMSGHELELTTLTVHTGGLGLGVGFVLTWMFGVYGAAIATALVVCLQNVAALVVVRRKLGFITF